MRVEIITVGTELLLGQILDTNSAWLGAALAEAGLTLQHTSTVGDNAGRIAAGLRTALERADAVIVCGGLGPTQDDLTRDVIAEVMGVELAPDENVAARIRAMFESRGRSMPANNLRQALVPVGAHLIAQQPGTAPGLLVEFGDQVLYALPGVPSEMKEMATGTVLPDLRRRAAERGETAVLTSRVMRTWGLAESKLAELLAEEFDLLDERAHAHRSGEPPVPTIAFLASGLEGIKVRLSVLAEDPARAAAVLDEEETRVRHVLGDCVFGLDEQSMESVVLARLRTRGWTCATAESLTAGYLSGRLAAVPGASDVLRGGVVSYASDVKHALLGVPPGPVVSEDAALAMARGVARLLGADVALATTGVAGPDVQEGRPVGTVCLAALTPEGSRTATVALPGGRENIRQLSVISALDLLRRLLDSLPDHRP